MPRKILILLMVALMLTGCADSVTFKEAASIEPVGFWYGLFHGAIVIVSFFVSIFDDSVAIYAIYNNGGWYDFGYVTGVSCFLVSLEITSFKTNAE